jgi:hypothetical protein
MQELIALGFVQVMAFVNQMDASKWDKLIKYTNT